MLTVNRLSKTYADNVILRDVSFSLSAGERVGLVGPNGAGKTTLLRLITGQEPPDSGTAQLDAHTRVGYLAQGLEAPPEATIQACLDLALGDSAQTESEVATLAAGLAHSPGDKIILGKYEAALARLQALSVRPDPGRVAATLTSLGLGGLPRSTVVASLSGGQKTRLALARVLLADPHLLLLDEPTNHLDLDMLLWLEDWLAHFRGAALVVSHDRAFLDQTVSTILELDADTHSVRAYPGNYSDYLATIEREHQHQWSVWRDQQSEIRRMKQDIARTKEQSLSVERTTTPRQPGVRRIAKKVARKALSREKKMERYLGSDERVEKPKPGWQMKLEFDDTPMSGRDVLTLEEASVGYDQPLLSHLNLTVRFGQRVALIGPNGSGKTTLARTLAGQLPPLGGRVRLGASVRVGYFSQEQELLRRELNALTTLQQLSRQTETDLRNFLHYFLFEGDDVFTPVAELSYGERARLALATLVIQGRNFLLLDEPINHLDIASRARFEQALTNFEGTSLVIAHDRYFIARYATQVWKVEAGTVKAYADLEDALKERPTNG
jgi:ATP-binding cassette subfamily F protein 3